VIRGDVERSLGFPPVDGPFPDIDLSQTAAASPSHGQFSVDSIRQP
jgi:hypothetical protein